MLQHEKNDALEGIDIHKSNHLKECMICHYWCFKDIGYKFQLNFCNGCHIISMTTCQLKYFAILNVKDVDYTCGLWNMTRNDSING